MKKLFTKEMMIGACVLIALAILFFGIEYLKGVSIFKPSNYYYAVYNDVKGLEVSAPVTVNGYKIGQVDNVELMYDRPGCVLVSMSLDKKFKIPVNSKALIESSLLGTASVKIDLASEDTFYTPGDTIPAGVAAGMMDQVSQQLLPGVSNLVPKVDSILTNVNTLTGNEALLQSFKNIEQLTSTLNTTAVNLNAAVKTLPSTVGAVNGVIASVNAIVADLDTVTSQIAEASIESTLENFNRISNDLAALTSQLQNPNSTLGALMNDSGLYDNLTKASLSIDSLLVDIRKNPKRYISIKLL
ncbi:MAG: MlaD family protein [Muribaculaceae bacterium]|nr:MlaD family protein [Muribaculaceae bacterium]